MHLFPRHLWRLKASAGEYYVWHSGLSHYSVTHGKQGEVIGTRPSLSEAFHGLAVRLHETDKLKKD